MNTITFSDYEASTTGVSSLRDGTGYNVEIKHDNAEWSIWALAMPKGKGEWELLHIRIKGNEHFYPTMNDISFFFLHVDAYVDTLMNKLIPSHQNANNEQV